MKLEVLKKKNLNQKIKLRSERTIMKINNFFRVKLSKSSISDSSFASIINLSLIFDLIIWLNYLPRVKPRGN